MKLISKITMAVVILFAAVQVNAQNFKIDEDKSTVTWKGYKVAGSHYGTIDIKTGNVKLDEGGLTGSGNVVIDMTTINTQDLSGEYKDKLDGHLSAPDFFDVENHQIATFEITKIRQTRKERGDDASHVFTGNLTIKDITKEVEFPANVTIKDGTLTATAAFSIDRTKWDIKYGSGSLFDGLGDKMIYDDFELELNITANEGRKMMNIKSNTNPSKPANSSLPSNR